MSFLSRLILLLFAWFPNNKIKANKNVTESSLYHVSQKRDDHLCNATSQHTWMSPLQSQISVFFLRFSILFRCGCLEITLLYAKWISSKYSQEAIDFTQQHQRFYRLPTCRRTRISILIIVVVRLNFSLQEIFKIYWPTI